MTKLFKIKLFKMDSLGETIRKLREEKELSDKLVYEVADEDVALKALQVAMEKVQFNNETK